MLDDYYMRGRISLDKDRLKDAIRSYCNNDRCGVFFKNLACDILHARLPSAVTRAFFENLDALIGGPRTYFSGAEAITDALKETTFEFQGPINRSRFGDMTTTTTLQNIKERLRDRRRFFLPPGLSPVESVAHVGADNLRAILRHNAEIRSSKPIVWLAPYRDIEAHFSGGHISADDLRSFLGLSHLIQDEYLVTLVFDGHKIGPVEKRRPTSFDAGPNMIFASDDSSRKHGFTVDLRDYSQGARELLSATLKCEVVKCVIPLGDVKTMPNFDWGSHHSLIDGDVTTVLNYVDSL